MTPEQLEKLKLLLQSLGLSDWQSDDIQKFVEELCDESFSNGKHTALGGH